MTEKILIVDFGASRVKAALWDLDGNCLVDQAEVHAPKQDRIDPACHEIDGEAYWRCLEATAGALLARHRGEGIASLWLCTEMHGFMLADMDGHPLTGYISWQDQRAVGDLLPGGQSTFHALRERHAEDFAEYSGMRMKPGLPIVNLSYLSNHGLLPEGRMRFLSLADWILLRGGSDVLCANSTLAAASGLYDIRKKEWNSEIIRGIFPGNELIFPEIRDRGAIGRIQLTGESLAVFGGLGDFQAALLGAGFSQDYRLALNLGTGSQVAFAGDRSADGFELRPWIDGQGIFSAITHVPSGRALNAFAGFFDGVARSVGGKDRFWELWLSLTPEEVLKSTVVADLCVFEAAWGYAPERGYIQIRERPYALKETIAGLASSWLRQYQTIVRKLSRDSLQKAIISGGLVRRGTFVAPVLSELLGFPCEVVPDSTSDETIRGLACLAESAR